MENPLSLNLYTYCHNEPIKYKDPTGHVVTQAEAQALAARLGAAYTAVAKSQPSVVVAQDNAKASTAQSSSTGGTPVKVTMPNGQVITADNRNGVTYMPDGSRPPVGAVVHTAGQDYIMTSAGYGVPYTATNAYAAQSTAAQLGAAYTSIAASQPSAAAAQANANAMVTANNMANKLGAAYTSIAASQPSAAAAKDNANAMVTANTTAYNLGSAYTAQAAAQPSVVVAQANATADSNRRPNTGEPGSTYTAPNGDTRTYGADGKPVRDVDTGHPNHHPDIDGPHVHDWPGGVRSKNPYPLNPVPPNHTPDNDNAAGIIIGGVTVVGGGYLIYRGLRLLPSLLPPLWWTLPANLVIP